MTIEVTDAFERRGFASNRDDSDGAVTLGFAHALHSLCAYSFAHEGVRALCADRRWRECIRIFSPMLAR